jgi:hypothetical protein
MQIGSSQRASRTCRDNRSEKLAQAGEEFLNLRTELLRRNAEGLTNTLNIFHDPKESGDLIQRLRDALVRLDNTTSVAYGWSDLDLGHGFHETKQGVRFTISESARREVLARLLKLNHERYAEEAAQGLHDKGRTTQRKGAAKAKKPAARGRKAKSAPAEPSLFGDEATDGDR